MLADPIVREMMAINLDGPNQVSQEEGDQEAKRSGREREEEVKMPLYNETVEFNKPNRDNLQT